ncbi:MAG: M48 family metalloprotease [Phycisphaerae bacterium]|nr:M48 family metalloprotease [Phycisphaerae bacterium]
MYLVVIGILAIVLTLSSPIYRLVAEPGLVIATAAAATLLPAVFGVLVTRRVLRKLDRHPQQPSRGQFVFGRGMTIIQFLLGACHAGVMLCTDWLPLCHQTPVIGTWPLVPGLLALVPFLLSIVLLWIVVYPADRAVRQIAVEVYLFRGKPLRPVWPLGQYLLYNLRHQVLFILIPMALILAASDLVTRYEQAIADATGIDFAPDMLVGLAAIAVAVVAPEILRHVWVTQSLPDGPLRDRLQLLCQRLRLRYRDILVWRSGGMIVNAAVMGVIAPLRYVLITDAMLEQMEDTKIEAVFGHEAGHVKHHHIPCFLLFALISGCIVTIFSVHAHGLPRTDYQILLTLLGLVLVFKWGVVFGWVSRRFERQADIHGVRTLTLTGLPCSMPCVLHSSGENPGQTIPGDPLCSTAAHVFGHALYEVALLNGIQPEARSWRHSSIASRSRFLQQLAQQPRRQQRFQRHVLLIQLVLLATAIITSLWAAYELEILSVLGKWLTGALTEH